MKTKNQVRNLESDASIFAVQTGCNCRICRRGRYEDNLLERIQVLLNDEVLAEELKMYLEWYYEALSHAETELEYNRFLELQKAQAVEVESAKV